MDYNRDYDNIVNYFGDNDVLTKGLIALGLEDRIPGERRDISFGVPYAGADLEHIGSSHTGFKRTWHHT